MQIAKIGSLTQAPKTNNINTPKHSAKTDFKNIGDTVSFGMSPKKVKQVLPEIEKFSPQMQELIDETVKLVKAEGGKITRQLSKEETAVAESLPDGNLKVTFENSVDNIIMTTNNGKLNVQSINKGKNSEIIEYELTPDAFLSTAFTITLKKHFSNIK